MSDFLNPIVLNYMPYAVGVILVLAGLFVVRILIRSAINKKVRSIRDAPSMSMMDIERMRKKGLIDERESRAIRRALAGSEVDKERRRKQAERERILLAQVEKDPEAARLLLDEPVGASSPLGARASSPASPATLGARTPSSATPAKLSKPSSAPAAAPAPASRPGDLDLLLEKGAITPEEYQRLKSFFQ